MVPLDGVPQSEGEGPKHTTRPLEPLQLRPLGVENLGQIGVEWVTRQVPLFGGASFLLRRIVQCVDPLKGGDDMWEKRLAIADRVRHKEPSPQHLGNILLDDRLNAFLTLTTEDG